MAEPRKMVAPDGGYGWIAVLGVSIVNFCTRSIEPSFGLLFGDLLRDLGVQTTGAAIVMSTLDALINFAGLFVGPLINTFSYRKVAILGAILTSLGLILTTWANSMAHIIATYSVINGLGVGFASSSTFVALNHYFVKKRGQAVGLTLAGTAIGMMFMPQAVSLLLEAYGFRGAVLILGAMALHGVVGSVVLQPAKWHLKPEKLEKKEEAAAHQEMETIKETEDEDEAEAERLVGHKPSHPDILVSHCEDAEKQAPMSRRPTFPRNFSVVSFTSKIPRNFSTMSFAARKRKDSTASYFSNLDFTGSCLQLHLQPADLDVSAENTSIRRNMSHGIMNFGSRQPSIKSIEQERPIELKPLEQKKSVWQKLVAILDLELLKDPIFLSLLFGLSIFYVAEQNFKMATPFFLAKVGGFSKSDIAFFLSLQAVTDIIARILLPPICDRCSITRRKLFMTAALCLGICRSVLAEQTDYNSILAWLVVCGFVRGAVLINYTICVSEYSSLEKLPAAFGLHMVGKGLFVVVLGPILGVIRDTTGSYPLCLHSQTVLIVIGFLVWLVEFVWDHFRSKKVIVMP